MIKDLTYMCFNEFNEYEQFKDYMPNKYNLRAYTKKTIEIITNDTIQNIISNLFYEKYSIEKLFSNYRFNKVYFTFQDFLNFIKHVDSVFGEISNKTYVYMKQYNNSPRIIPQHDDNISEKVSSDSDCSISDNNMGINFVDSPSSYV